MSQVSPSATVGLHPPSGLALRSVLDLSSQVLCVCDLAGRVVWCNLEFERTLGYPAGEVLGRHLGDLAGHEGRDALTRAGMPSDGGSEAAEPSDVPAPPPAPAPAPSSSPSPPPSPSPEMVALAGMRRADGTVRTVDWRVRVDRQRGLVFAAGRDVTERQAADEALRASEARLRALVSHSPTPIFVKDLSGRYLLANDAWCRLSGRAPADVIGLTEAEIHPGNATRLAEIEGQLATRGSVAGDLHLETPDGPHDLMVSVFTLTQEDGTRFAVCGIAADITERKRVESTLMERQRLLETVLDASPDVITLIDENGAIAAISSAEQVIFGYRHRQWSDSELYSLVHPDDFDHVASAFIAMVTGSRSQLHVRYRVRHADGRWITVDSRAQSVTDGDGRFRGAVMVVRDVSERIASELRLHELRRAAEQASRAKSDFLSRMSHELRTPLNAILGFSQLLQMDDLAVAQGEAVDHILRAGRHLLELIDEVLDIARIETGHLELAVRPVHLSDVVAEAMSLSRPMAERAEVAVQSAVEGEDSPAVLADRRRLLQVLLNLVSNAVKYNRPGGRVDISSEVTSAGRVRLAVADTGQGIRPEDMAGVFEPFNRLGAQQTGVEGTGVGLALAKNLVERMQGTLEVESVSEVGSTFFVELPLAVVPDGAGAASQRRAAGAAGAAGGAGPAFRVLLVEENLQSLELVERVMSRRPGVVVLAAMHGRMALDLAREHHPDLVLLDLHLPDIAGSALLEQLGQDPATASIPVAVLSADASGAQVRRLLGRGVAGQLAKPIDVRALLSLVDAARAAAGK